ncbi:MAG: RdgB/HAM1 family non-canonical purine NTP pyrophosphatase [Verrucomicrobiota bacterium]
MRSLAQANPVHPVNVHSLLIATHNPHKTREFAQILGTRYAVRDLTTSPAIPEVEETGASFAENAIIKANHASNYSTDLVVADDSGLVVDALADAPGIFSARYAGPEASDEENRQKLLEEIARARDDDMRFTARFRCVLALSQDGKLLQTFEGVTEGTITRSPRGAAGFGYDPIFLPDGFEQTFAEIPPEVKNRISHRAQAIAQLAEYLADHQTF